MKKAMSLLLVFCIILTPLNSFATDSHKDYISKIFDKELKDFELIEGEDYKNIISRFEQEGKYYELRESISDNLSEVNSTLYEIVNGEVIEVGNLKTEIKADNYSNSINIIVKENKEVVKVDTITIKYNNEMSISNDNNQLINSTNSYPIYDWVYSGEFTGSNTILQYTVSTIIVILATAAGMMGNEITTLGGNALGNIAEKIVSERWERVYWKSQQWLYRVYNGMFWTTIGNRSKNWYYSDRNHKNLIGYSYVKDI